MHHTLLLTNEVIVVGVATDPKPQHAIRDADTQGAVRQSDADRLKPANLFVVQGGVAGVVFQQGETLAGKLLNRLGESS